MNNSPNDINVHGFEHLNTRLLEVYRKVLPNGLTLLIAPNQREPRILTRIGFRAGSKHDPEETTGLAHYMEHLLFKGTQKIGTLDWEKESTLLEEIAELYEAHKNTSDPEEKKALFTQIDTLSVEAAKLSSPGEYDKLASSIGADRVNAYTWVDQTVYLSDIPSNELERWFSLESERFSYLAMRLFHTELETVFEEFNMIQTNDGRKVSKAMFEGLFPHHPYGKWSTIGNPEHLKNPSQYNIREFFEQYYVPNNMCIVLTGDVDLKEASILAEQYFGHFEAKPKPEFEFTPEPPRETIETVDIYGEEDPFVAIAWRLPTSKNLDALSLTNLVEHILYNQQAGLIDLNITQKQTLLEAMASGRYMEDYGFFMVSAKPREGQSLDEAATILLNEVNRLRTGNYPDWMIEASFNDLKLGEYYGVRHQPAIAHNLLFPFLMDIDPAEYLNSMELNGSRTKEEVATFANTYLGDNYVLIRKNQGKDPSLITVDKPAITPVTMNREELSAFAMEFLKKETPAIKPQFLDFDSLIDTLPVKGQMPFFNIKNHQDPLFQFDLHLKSGKYRDKHVPIALLYLEYLGVGQLSPSEWRQDLFRKGLNIDFRPGNLRSQISLNGLQENAMEGLDLLWKLLFNYQGNQQVLDRAVDDILLKRENIKTEKQSILRHAVRPFLQFGQNSPFLDRLSKDQLRNLQPKDMEQALTRLWQTPGEMIMYSSLDSSDLTQKINALQSTLPVGKGDLLDRRRYTPDKPTKKEIFLLNYPNVQLDILLGFPIADQLEKELFFFADWFNDYYGLGLSSVIFQEIREARALAYSAYGLITSPLRQDSPHFFQAYLGTQPDKLQEAISTLDSLLQDMPVDLPSIERCRQGIISRMNSERLKEERLYSYYQQYKDLGFERDPKPENYRMIQDTQPEKLIDIHKKYIAGKPWRMVIMGDLKQIDRQYLESIGQVTEIDMPTIFGY